MDMKQIDNLDKYLAGKTIKSSGFTLSNGLRLTFEDGTSVWLETRHLGLDIYGIVGFEIPKQE